MKCPKCKGTGKITRIECTGRTSGINGFLIHEPVTHTCKECNGTGKIKEEVVEQEKKNKI